MSKFKFLLVIVVAMLSFGYISYTHGLDGDTDKTSVLSTQLAEKVFSSYKTTIDKKIKDGKLTSKNFVTYLQIVAKSTTISSARYSEAIKNAAKKIFIESVTKYVNDYFGNSYTDTQKSTANENLLSTASKAKKTKANDKIASMVAQAKREIAAKKSKTTIGKGASTLAWGEVPGQMKKEFIYTQGDADPTFVVISGVNFSSSGDLIGAYNKSTMLVSSTVGHPYGYGIAIFAAFGDDGDMVGNQNFAHGEDMGVFYYDKESDKFYDLQGTFKMIPSNNIYSVAKWYPLTIYEMTNVILGNQITIAYDPLLTQEKVQLNGLPSSFEVGESREIYFDLMEGLEGNVYDAQYQILNGIGIVHKYPGQWNNKLHTFGYATYEVVPNDTASVTLKVTGKSIFDNHIESKEQSVNISRRSFVDKNILYENPYFAIYMENGAMYFGTKQGQISARISGIPYRNYTFTTNKKDFLLTDVPGRLLDGKTYTVEYYTFKNENHPTNPTTVQLNQTFVISGGTQVAEAFLQWTLPSTWTNAQAIPLTYTGKNLKWKGTSNGIPYLDKSSVEIVKGNGVLDNFKYIPSIKNDSEVILKISGIHNLNTNLTLTDTKTININIPAITNPFYTNQYLTIYKSGNMFKIRKEDAKDIKVKLSWTNGGITKTLQSTQIDGSIGLLSNYIGKTITVTEYSVKNLDGNTGWTTFPSGATFTVQ